MAAKDLHILIVEDEPAHAVLIRKAFAGHVVIDAPVRLSFAVSLREARERLRGVPPDLLIVDLRLPDGSGIDLLPEPPDRMAYPVVIVTSRGAEREAVEAIKAGALDYVVKSPQTLEELPRIAARALREWRHIVERRHAEHRLERFRFMLDQAHDAFYVVDPGTGRFVDFNRTAVRQLGYSREALLQLSIRDVEVGHQAFEDEEGLAAMVKHYRRQDRLTPLEGRHRRRDGSTFPVEVSLAVDTFAGKAYLLLVARDISTRKEAERTIRTWEANFEKIFKVSPHTMMITSVASGRVLEVNDHFAEATDYGREEVVGQPVEGLNLWVDPGERKRFTRQVLAGGRVRNFEVLFRLRSGEERICLISGELVELEGELCIFTITRDITERKQLEEHIRRANEELERQVQARAERIQELERQRAEAEKLAATGRMAAGIAHEINNPLASIMSSFELVARAIPPENPWYAYVRRIEQDLDRVARIIQQMYNLYKPTTEAAQTLSCAELLQEIKTLLDPFCRQRSVELRLRYAGAPLPLRLPPTSVHQVVWNLVQNAVTASLPGGVVEAEAETDAGRLYLTVTDHGSGIPPAVQPRIFEPFFSTCADGSMGLGLTITQSLVRAMGGQITFHTRPGQGTTFRIQLPRELPRAEVPSKSMATIG